MIDIDQRRLLGFIGANYVFTDLFGWRYAAENLYYIAEALMRVVPGCWKSSPWTTVELRRPVGMTAVVPTTDADVIVFGKYSPDDAVCSRFVCGSMLRPTRSITFRLTELEPLHLEATFAFGAYLPEPGHVDAQLSDATRESSRVFWAGYARVLQRPLAVELTEPEFLGIVPSH